MITAENSIREPTEAETTGYQLRLIARLLRDILDGNREQRAKEALTTDRDTMFLVLPNSLAHFQVEAWIGALGKGADLIDPDDFYAYKRSL